MTEQLSEQSSSDPARSTSRMRRHGPESRPTSEFGGDPKDSNLNNIRLSKESARHGAYNGTVSLLASLSRRGFVRFHTGLPPLSPTFWPKFRPLSDPRK